MATTDDDQPMGIELDWLDEELAALIYAGVPNPKTCGHRWSGWNACPREAAWILARSCGCPDTPTCAPHRGSIDSRRPFESDAELEWSCATCKASVTLAWREA